MRMLAISALILGIGGALARADIPAPDPPPRKPQPVKKTQRVKLIETADRGSSTTRLVIPRSLVEGAIAAQSASIGSSRTRTIVAGVALSLAFVSLLLLRKKAAKPAAAAAVLAVGLFVTQFATADGPPSWYFRGGKETKSIVLEIADEGESVQLIWAGYRPSRNRGEPKGEPRDGAAPPEVPSDEPR